MSHPTLAPLWYRNLDPVTKLVALAYAEQADLAGWVPQPDLALVVAMTGLSLHAVQALTRQLLTRGVLVAGHRSPASSEGRSSELDAADPATWGSRVAAEGR